MPDRPQAAGSGQVFYRYETQDGRLVIVDALSKVPKSVRGDVQRIDFTGNGAPSEAGSYNVVAAPPVEGAAAGESSPGGLRVDPASFGMGAGAGLVGAGVLYLLFARRGGGLTRLLLGSVLLLGIAALGMGVYLGSMRRVTGLGDDAVVSPIQLVEDAKEAVREVEAHREAQDRAIESAQELAK